MEKFWVSNNAMVSGPLTREEVQEQFINAGASLDIPVLKIGDGEEWKTAAHYGFAKAEPPPKKTEAKTNEPDEIRYEAVSPVVFLNDERFCYVFGKTESDRSRLSHALADFLNDHKFKSL